MVDLNCMRQYPMLFLEKKVKSRKFYVKNKGQERDVVWLEFDGISFFWLTKASLLGNSRVKICTERHIHKRARTQTHIHAHSYIVVSIVT